jgi:hypothetical protein
MKYLILFVPILLFLSCKNDKKIYTEHFKADDIHFLNRKMLEISMEDVFNPPVASRVFCYPNLAAFEVLSHKKNISPINTLYPNTIKTIISDTANIDYSIAAVYAYLKIGKLMVFSEHLMDSLHHEIDNRTKTVEQKIVLQSKEYANKVCQDMMAFINHDQYEKVKSDDFYTLKNTDSSWVLTPPTYTQPLEPNWKNLRTLAIGKVDTLSYINKPNFSKDKNSDFYKAALAVYNQSKTSDKEAMHNIALHWDCNPNEYNNKGHNTYFVHKISPPGHWVNITKILCQNNNASLEKTIKSYALVTTSIFDAMIACWHIKYKEELLRPVSYINRYIDATWQPFIETPPFPEYTSGHSSVSGASAQVLSSLFNNTKFTDDTEVEFGLPKRSFDNVNLAAEEASISRFYGGIHYKFGVDNGLAQGKKIGNIILNKLNQ